MPDIYLRSTTGSDANDGSSWAAAKASLSAAVTAAGNGGRVFVSQAHNESPAAAITINAPASPTDAVQILCVSDSAAPPTTLATSAVVATSTSSYNVTFNGYGRARGITFRGSNILINSASAWGWSFEDCVLAIGINSLGSTIAVGAQSSAPRDQRLELRRTKVSFTNTAQRFNVRCPFLWEDTSPALDGGVVPVNLIMSAVAPPGRAILRGVDLSQLDTNPVVGVTSAQSLVVELEGCKLAANAVLFSGDMGSTGGIEVYADACDSAGTSYRMHHQTWSGTVTQETTIVRTGGASDGTTPISWRAASNANTRRFFPLIATRNGIALWNDTSGASKTVTMHVVTDNVTLTDADCWLEVYYPSDASSAQMSLATSRLNNPLSSGTNYATDTDAWTTTGLTTPVKQKLTVTFTPARKGPFIARFYLAKASTTIYLDPKVDVA